MPENPSISENDFVPETVDRAAKAKERVRITRDGKDIAALVPIEDLEFLENLEDRIDVLEALEAVQEAVEKGGKIPWEKFEKELGL